LQVVNFSGNLVNFAYFCDRKQCWPFFLYTSFAKHYSEFGKHRENSLCISPPSS